MNYGVIYALESEDKLLGFCCAGWNNLLCEGQGEALFCCSDGVLCLHMGHVFCVGVVDGHHTVSHPDTGLSRLPAWGQLDRRKQKLDILEDGSNLCD